MSHLVYITLFGETDGVILSRLQYILVVNHIGKHIKHWGCKKIGRHPIGLESTYLTLTSLPH